MDMSDDCVFCKIIDGEIPSNTVYEDENVIAFLDANPVSKGHTLVVPKKHIRTIHEASGMEYMWDTIVKVSNAVEDAFDPGGINVTANNGEVAGQEVHHLHFHVTPRYTGDEIELDYNRSELEEGDEIAGKIEREI